MTSKEIIVRHNDLIECIDQTSVQERRIMAWGLSEIMRNDKEFKEIEMSIKDFTDFVGLKKSKEYYNRIKGMQKNLQSRVAWIEKDGRHRTFNWFEFIEYDTNKGKMIFKFHKDMKPLLLYLEGNFTPVEAKYLLLLKRYSSHRLYELMRQYSKIGRRTIEIGRLRKLLKCENKYPRYNDFQTCKIIPAQKEIAEKTDIFFRFIPIKRGKKIECIEFFIYKKKKVYEGKKISKGIEDEIDKLRGKCDRENKKRIEEFIQNMSPEERTQNDNSFREKFTKYSDRIDKKLSDIPVRALYFSMIREKYNEVTISYKEYAKKKGVYIDILNLL